MNIAVCFKKDSTFLTMREKYLQIQITNAFDRFFISKTSKRPLIFKFSYAIATGSLVSQCRLGPETHSSHGLMKSMVGTTSSSRVSKAKRGLLRSKTLTLWTNNFDQLWHASWVLQL